MVRFPPFCSSLRLLMEKDSWWTENRVLKFLMRKARGKAHLLSTWAWWVCDQTGHLSTLLQVICDDLSISYSTLILIDTGWGYNMAFFHVDGRVRTYYENVTILWNWRKIIFSEVSQTQKPKSYIFSLICGISTYNTNTEILWNTGNTMGRSRLRGIG
jgi:hypothetical protein